MGDDHTLGTLIESLQGLLEGHQEYGSGTRRYKCIHSQVALGSSPAAGRKREGSRRLSL